MSAPVPFPGLYIGLISGTSMDGIDTVLVELDERRCQVLAAKTFPYEAALRAELLRASRNPAQCSVDVVGRLDNWTGAAFRDATLALLRETETAASAVTAIGSHGQTLRHQPRAERPFTLQIGDANLIAEGTGITTVADFRRRDLALGGEGAPLAPAFHQWLFADESRFRALLNIGGFANVTLLPPGNAAPSGFDTGPGNTLMDSWHARHRGKAFDNGGSWAASGSVDADLLARMLADPYFAQEPPKSTGFEYFDDAWLERMLAGARIAAEDVQSTLCELTARTIAAAISGHTGTAADVLVCGGGVHNRYLMQRLADLLAPSSVATTGDLGLDPDWVEGAAFAWLAARTLQGEPGNLPAITGASKATVLGSIFPASR